MDDSRPSPLPDGPAQSLERPYSASADTGVQRATLDSSVYRYFLELETYRSIRYSHFFSLCHLMLDQPQLCDESTLQSTAVIVRETIRTTDLIGILEPSYLSILLLNSEITTAYQVAERIRARIEEQNFVAGSKPRRLTASIGSVCFPTHGNDAESLLNQANELLALAKKNGGNQTSIPTA